MYSDLQREESISSLFTPIGYQVPVDHIFVMDAWRDVSAASQHAVYLGQWTNWSRGPVFGATLTLTRPNGSLVIAFAAFFVTLVAARVWVVVCLCSHQIYSSSQPRDVAYHQRQVILRNSPSPQSALWKFLRLGWISRRTYPEKAWITIAPITLAILCLAGFAGVTYVLPLLSTSQGDEVLLLPGVCGRVNLNKAVQNFTEWNESVQPETASQITDAANYAQQCYSNSTGALGCTGFVKDHIPSVVQFDAKCPYHEAMCRSQDSNLFLDTGYLSFHDHFGLNMPPDKRLSYRRTLHCAPLVTEGYSNTETVTERSGVTNYTSYHHGFLIQGTPSRKHLSDGLYMIEDVATQYRFGTPFGNNSYPAPTREFQVEYVAWAAPLRTLN